MPDKTSAYAGVGTAYLSEHNDGSDEDGAFLIHGVALGASDITIGQSGIKKLWPAEELERAASTLAGTNLVRDHINTSEGKIGEVLHAQYVENVGVVYEAEIASHYEDVAKDIRAGLMEVSVRAYHLPEEELTRDDETGALIVENITFDNLSVVTNGASPSNTANTGPVSNIIDDPSTVEASASVGDDRQVATLTRAEPFDRDTSDGVFDGEEASVTVEETPTEGEPVADEDETGESELDVPGLFEADGTMFAIAPDEHESGSTSHPENAKYPLTSCTGDDSIESAWNLRGHGDYTIEQSTLEKRIRGAAEQMECDLDLGTEEASSNSFDPVEGDMVKWQSNPQMAGKVVHNPDDRPIVMVDVYRMNDGEYISTGHTITAGYADVIPMEKPGTMSESESEEASPDTDSEMELDASDTSPDTDETDSESSSLMYHKDTAEKMEFDPDEPDVFESVDEAMSRAMKLGLEDTHTHEYEETTYYMPGEDHEAYKEAVSESGSHDDEEDDEEMSASSDTTWATVATSTAPSESHQARNSELSTTMINFETADAEELSDELDDPVVVERSELEDLSESAEKAESVQDEIDELSGKLDEQSDATKIVESLSEEDIDLIEAEDDAVVVENAKAEMFDEVTEIYAEELADYSPFTAEDLAERFSPVTLKERVDSHEEAELSSSIEDVEPEPDAGNAAEEELGEEAEEAAEEEALREEYAEELENAGWNTQAQKVRDGELPVTQG